MDLLLAESVIADPEFCRLLLDKTDLKGKPFSVAKVELSKTDANLGESDVTVIIDIEGESYGLLIEDKINAIAMPRQFDRYVERGNLGKKNGEYKDYKVFIFCPKKYYDNNTEAKKYSYLLEYEECLAYFDKKNDLLSRFRSQQLYQAIHKTSGSGNVNINKEANQFLRKYIDYQRENHPSLDMSTKENRNGYWIDYRTNLGYVYIVHKIQEGYVDLIFPKASDSIDRVKIIAEWVRHHGMPDASVIKAKKSSMLRIRVPKLSIEKGFDTVNKDELNKCFDTIKELTDFANMIEMTNTITVRN